MSLTRNGFQGFVNTNSPPGVVGQMASMNPRATVLAGSGALKADSVTPVIVGYFARADLATSKATGNLDGDGVIGFVANELQTIITTFLGQDRLSVQAGFPVTLFSHGDFWTNVVGATPATVGDPVYGVLATGQPTTDSASAANPDTGFIIASAPGATATANGNSVIAAGTGVLSVPGAVTGTLEAGQVISGTGVPANVFILSQISGTAGAGGGATYQTNYQGAAVPAFTNLSATSGQLVKISRTF